LVEHKKEKGWKVIGCLPQHLFRFFQYVMAHPGVTSKDVAQDLGVSLKTASLCLKRLSELRLLRAEREIRPQGGFQYRFLPLV
jgi:predicted transcriptional regulator